MRNEEKCFSLPDNYVIIPMNDWFIFFDPVHFSYTRVNDHGRAILETVDQELTAKQVARKVAATFNLEPIDIEHQVAVFLENMVTTKFLHEGTYNPEIPEPYDMDKAVPHSLYISPTFNCNLKCLYCYNKEEREKLAGVELTTKEWFSVLDQAREFGIEVVAFTGGEPLLRKDVYDIAEYANHLGMATQLLTNAMMINDRNIDKITRTFGSLALSLDSHIKEKNDFLRGRGAYERTINAAQLLRERDHTYTIMAVITKHNVADIPELYKFSLQELKTRNIFSTPYIPNSLDDVDLLPKLEDYMNAMARVAEVVDEFYGKDKVSVLQFHGKPVRHNHCGAAATEISIDADGTVYPCQAFHKMELCAGNVKETKLQDIFYQSPVMKQVRRCTVDRIETCRECDIANVCGGGCRSLAYNLYGKLDSCNSYNCDYLKSMVYNSFWTATCIPIEQLRELQEEETKKKDAKGIQ